MVRCFEDENVIHVDGKIDPLSDIEIINTELILSDMELLERRIQKTEKNVKSDKTLGAELELLRRVYDVLAEGKSARILSNTFSKEEDEFVRSLELLSYKPVIYAANVSEKEVAAPDNDLVKAVKKFAASEGSEAVVICAKIEEELAELDDEEKKLTAYHEAGHALVLQLVAKKEPLHKITIIPRGTAYLGATMQLPEKDRYTESNIKLKSTLAGLMGGRTAEELIFGDITTGAGNDLKQATHIARLMVCNWGMSRELGPQTFGAQEELLFLGREVARNHDFSDDTSKRIDAEVSRLLREAHEEAAAILRQNREKLDLIAALLIERETLDGRDIEEIVRHGHILQDEERAKLDAENNGADAGENSKNPDSAVADPKQDEKAI